MKPKPPTLLSRFREGKGAALTAVISTAAFFNYAMTPACLAQTPSRQITVSEGMAALAQRLDEVVSLLKHQDAEMKVVGETLTRAIQMAKDPAAKPKDTKSQEDSLKSIAEKAQKGGQPDLADAIVGAKGVVTDTGALKGLASITKDTPREQVDKLTKKAKEQVDGLVKQANDTINKFREAARSAPKELLNGLRDKALQELAKVQGPALDKLRKTVESYLPPALKAELAQSGDLVGFVKGLLEKGKYPELIFEVLQEKGLLPMTGDGKLDFHAIVKALGLPPELAGPLETLLPLFANADRAHDAAMETAVMAQTLLTDAMMTGNPYVIAIAAIIAALMFIFGGGGVGGGGDGDDGDGPGHDGQQTGIANGDGKNPADKSKDKPKDSGEHEGGQGSDVPADPGVDFRIKVTPKGPAVFTGTSSKTRDVSFSIPFEVYKSVPADAVAGDGKDPDSLFNLEDWTTQHIAHVEHEKDSTGGETLTIIFDGAKAKKKLELTDLEGKNPRTFQSVNVRFVRTGDKVTAKVTSGTPADASEAK